jgi:hypothetical protein
MKSRNHLNVLAGPKLAAPGGITVTGGTAACLAGDRAAGEEPAGAPVAVERRRVLILL